MKIFIGFTNERPDVSKVCKNSIESWNTTLDINYVSPDTIPGWTRKRLPNQATNHSFARFLVPHLSNYEGYSIFMDDDFIVECNLTETMKYINHNNSISVVQHDYVPILNKKMLGEGYENVQIKYPRKNWASFMLFNNSHLDCKKLTLDYVNTASAKELIELRWTNSIGKLPLKYNFLVEEYEHIDDIKCYHYTLGGPWIKEKKSCPYSKKWKQYKQ